jgi:hypothetical protein
MPRPLYGAPLRRERDQQALAVDPERAAQRLDERDGRGGAQLPQLLAEDDRRRAP